MKEVCLYNPSWSTLGGGEKYLLALAQTLAGFPDTTVKLLFTDDKTSKEKLQRFFNVPLLKNEFVLLKRGEKEIKNVTHRTDLFVYLSNYRPIESRARKKVLLLQVPYAQISVFSVLKRFIRGSMKEGVKDLYRVRLMSHARHHADLVVVYSRFVGDTLIGNFSVRSRVLHPPIQDFHIEGISKKNIILSVGRFFEGLYNRKRYDILTEAFRKVSRNDLTGWEYHLVGSYVPDPASKKMLETLHKENQGLPVRFHINEPYESLRRLYNEATIFWHAAGYGVDETVHPENVEHFGMTTAEAMSAGCIPIVINKGGQKEIVRHGVDGYLWNSTDELLEYTVAVAQGKAKGLDQMRQNARKRSQDFSTERFRQRTIELFSPFLT